MSPERTFVIANALRTTANASINSAGDPGRGKTISSDPPVQRTRGRHQSPQGNDQYFKSALFLHTMRSVMNDDTKWWALVREVYDTFKYKNILTEDVSTLFTKRFGKDTVPLFNQYLKQTVLPELELVFDAPAKKVSYRWKAAEARFAMPVRVGANGTWLVIEPTTEWKRMATTLTKESIAVATDLYYIDVVIR